MTRLRGFAATARQALRGSRRYETRTVLEGIDISDAALAQGAGYIQFVIYNLPGRDCAALASNGELGTTELPNVVEKIAGRAQDLLNTE